MAIGGLSRRALLAGAAAGMANDALAVPRPAALVAAPGTRDNRALLDAIGGFAAAELAAVGLPGVTVAVLGADGLRATLCTGWADLAGRVPNMPDRAFQLGSLSKMVTGLWFHAAAAAGRLRLDDPVARWLPDLPLPPAPITLRQLLNHQAGLADAGPLFPPPPADRLWTGFAPGSRFSYSNIGYDLLGLVIDRVAGRPHAQVLETDVLAPLGMAGATASLRTADRPRFATGYQPLLDDRPALANGRLAAAPWVESDAASSSVGAPGTAFAALLGYLVRLGQGHGAPLLPDRAAAALLADQVPAPAFGARARYAAGIASQVVDGRRLLHHTGGVPGFCASLHVDPAAGVGCIAAVNGRLGDWRPTRITAHTVGLLRAARGGRAAPAAPGVGSPNRVRDPRRFVGRWVAANGERLELALDGPDLVLLAENARGRVEAAGDRSLATDLPSRSLHPLDFEPAHAPFTRLWWGDVAFGRRAPSSVAIPPALARLSGRYAPHDPWGMALRVFARGDRLWAEPLGEITRRDGGWWAPADDKGGLDRIWFDQMVDGRPTRALVNGIAALRVA